MAESVRLGGSAVECVMCGGSAAKLSGPWQHSGELDNDYPEGIAHSPSWEVTVQRV